jgi:hypothetical protein
MIKDQQILTNLQATPFGPTVMLPDSSNIQATHSGQLPFHPSFSEKAKQAHVLDGITNASLISLGQLCHDGCVAILYKAKIKIFKDKTCVVDGTRNTSNGLWDIRIPVPLKSTSQQSTKHQLNAII